jgi:hypothetical protein
MAFFIRFKGINGKLFINSHQRSPQKSFIW